MRITFLGTGTSHGVPAIDCMLDDYAHCPLDICRKALVDSSYRRTRASILVQTSTSNILIDTSQDFREQMLKNRIKRIDTILYTHAHADHIFGLPDVRSYCRRQNDAIDIYASGKTLQTIKETFDYIFHPPDYLGGGIPSVRPHTLNHRQEIANVTIIPLPVEHGSAPGCQGYRIEDIAYIPDVHTIPEATLEQLQHLNLLIINCLRLRPHSSHLSLQEALSYANQLKPTHCFLTHMSHDIDYRLEQPHLPKWIRFAQDGLVIEV